MGGFRNTHSRIARKSRRPFKRPLLDKWIKFRQRARLASPSRFAEAASAARKEWGTTRKRNKKKEKPGRKRLKVNAAVGTTRKQCGRG